MRRPKESHTEVSSRIESDKPERLNRARPGNGHEVNEPSSRVEDGYARPDLPPMVLGPADECV